MPIRTKSSYTPPWFLQNGHALTLWASLCRKPIPVPLLRRERLHTPDNDFIDVDFMPSKPGTKPETVAVLSHGLEGHSRRGYILSASRAFLMNGVDVAARNFRACSGEINRTPGMYHSGETNDLHLTVTRCIALGYRRILLVGFSMGGNQTLRYLAESRVPQEIAGAAVFSVPCDLVGAAHKLAQPAQAIYMVYFMRTLRQKIRQKHALYPDLIPIARLEQMKNFEAFDNAYTAPLHGFDSALDYWTRASSLESLPLIRVPTLLVNAKDDPFLSPSCYPYDAAAVSDWLFLETPKHGGHVGFVSSKEPWWVERRVIEWMHQAGSLAL